MQSARSCAIRCLQILSLALLSCLSALAQGPQEQKVPTLDDLTGIWKLTTYRDDQAIVEEIVLKGDGGDENVYLRGRHEWRGTYSKGILKLQRNPAYAEVDPSAPDWVRKEVTADGPNRLKWRMELQVSEKCGMTTLEGTWLAGEISWSQKADVDGTVLKQSASITGDGSPIRVRCVLMQGEKPPKVDLVPRPYLVVRPWDPNMPAVPVDSLCKADPFRIDLILPIEQATSAQVQVTLKAEKGGGTATVKLTSFRKTKRSVAYSTEAPILFERPFDIAGPSDVVYSPYTSQYVTSLKAGNEESILVTYPGASEQRFIYFNSWVQQGIARNEHGFRIKEATLKDLMNSPLPKVAKEEVHQKLRAIGNARKIIAYQPGPDDRFNDIDRFLTGSYYHELLDTWQSPANANNDKWRRLRGTVENVFGGILLTSEMESDAIFTAKKDARDKGYTELLRTFGQLTLTMYQIVAQLTGGDQIVTVFFGINSMGEHVGRTERILAGINLGFQQLHLVANGQLMAELSTSQARIGRYGAAMRAKSTALVEPPFVVKRPVGAAASDPYAYELDINLARQDYGPSAQFVKIGKDESLPVQISNTSCEPTVVGHMINEAQVELGMQKTTIPEKLLTTVLAKNGYYDVLQGTFRGGAELIITAAGGRAGRATATTQEVRELLAMGYKLVGEVQDLRPGSTRHAVRIRDIVDIGQDFYVIFDDPAYAKRVVLSACEFEKIFTGDVLAADFGQVRSEADLATAPPLLGGAKPPTTGPKSEPASVKAAKEASYKAIDDAAKFLKDNPKFRDKFEGELGQLKDGWTDTAQHAIDPEYQELVVDQFNRLGSRANEIRAEMRKGVPEVKPTKQPDYIRENRPPKDSETVLADTNKFQRTKVKPVQGRTVYLGKDGRYYYVDNFHGGSGAEIEVFDARGNHLGTVKPDGTPNALSKDPKKKLNLHGG